MYEILKVSSYFHWKTISRGKKGAWVDLGGREIVLNGGSPFIIDVFIRLDGSNLGGGKEATAGNLLGGYIRVAVEWRRNYPTRAIHRRSRV